MKRFTIGIIIIGILFPLLSAILNPDGDMREPIYWSVGCVGIWIVVIFVNWIKKK